MGNLLSGYEPRFAKKPPICTNINQGKHIRGTKYCSTIHAVARCDPHTHHQLEHIPA